MTYSELFEFGERIHSTVGEFYQDTYPVLESGGDFTFGTSQGSIRWEIIEVDGVEVLVEAWYDFPYCINLSIFCQFQDIARKAEIAYL